MKSNYILISLLILSIFSSSIVISQITEIKGKVTDDTAQPLPFATTLLLKATDSTMVKATITDDYGAFRFQNIEPITYIIKVSNIGYTTFFSKKIDPKERIVVLDPIQLTTATETLNEVAIIVEKPIVEVLADKTVFNVDKTINATGSTGFELLRKAPGVIIDNNNSIIVEGKTGVQIYIDGRPSVLSGQDLINYLETLQSTDIDSIEIITQPSSKYEAAGNAGIINIKLKRDSSLGTNGSLTAGYTQGKYPGVNSSISLNNRGKKTNIYGTYSNRFDGSYGFINLDRIQNGKRFDSKSASFYDDNNHNFKTGFDYYATSKSTFGIIATANFNNSISKRDSRTPIIPAGASEPSEILLSKSDSDNVSYNTNLNLNYKFTDTLGHSLSVDLDYGKYNRDRSNYQPNYYVNAAENDTLRSSIVKFITPIDIDILAAQFDYEQNFLKGKISAGGRISYVNTDNTFNFFDVLNGQDIFNQDQSNVFTYKEQINAAYFNYNIKWEKWNFQAGLRMEQTISEGELTSNQTSNDALVKRNYVNFFPSGGATYQVNDKNSLALTYSRRIQRPNYQSLNPFQYKIDELSFSQGNPFLQPQYTNNIKLSHTWNYRLTTSLSYSYVSDFFAQVTEALGEDQNFLITRNVANQRTYNLGMSYPTKITDWWNVYLSLNAYRSEYIPTSPDFIGVDQNTLSFYGQNTFTLPAKVTMEVSGWYSSPSIWGGTYQTKSLGSLDVAFQRKFFAEQMTARLAFSDILYTIPWRGTTQFGSLFIDGTGGSDSRQIRFSLNYNFGSSDIKKARRRNTGIEEEQDRIGN